MSLDNSDPNLIKLVTALRTSAATGRADFISAVSQLHSAICDAIRTINQEAPEERVRDRFASALEDAVTKLEPDLPTDEQKNQYRRLYQYFQETLDETFEDSSTNS